MMMRGNKYNLHSERAYIYRFPNNSENYQMILYRYMSLCNPTMIKKTNAPMIHKHANYPWNDRINTFPRWKVIDLLTKYNFIPKLANDICRPSYFYSGGIESVVSRKDKSPK